MSKHAPQAPYSSLKTIGIVAQRELSVLLRTKTVTVFIIRTAIILVIGIFVAAFFMNKSDGDHKQTTIAVVGVDTNSFEIPGYSLVQAADRSTAETDVKEKKTTFSLIRTDTGFDLLSNGDIDKSDLAAINQAVAASDLRQTLAALNVTPEEFASAEVQSTVTPINVSPKNNKDASYYARLFTVLFGGSVVVGLLFTFSALMGSRICEEKSSRVVEIIMASVRPIDFLTGKIIGNLLFGSVASAFLLGIGAISMSLSGILNGATIDYGVFPLLLIMFFLGMLFFSSLYAAAGAMVSRTEDLQSTQMPILLIIFLVSYTPFLGFMKLNSTLMQVLSWIPPTSLLTAPLQYVAGNFTVSQLALSWSLFFLVSVLVVVMASMIYKRAITHTGTKLSWLKVFKKAS